MTGACALAFPVNAASLREPGLSDDKYIPGPRRWPMSCTRRAASCVQYTHHGKVALMDVADGRPVIAPNKPGYEYDYFALADSTGEEVGRMARPPAAGAGVLGRTQVSAGGSIRRRRGLHEERVFPCGRSRTSDAAGGRRLVFVTPHQSDSAVQREAETAIIDALAAKLGVALVGGGTLPLDGGAHIHLDARSENGKVVVEAYARQGTLKGGQLKKIAQDVLKLALLRREPGYTDVRPIIVFASEEARSSITGWVQHAAGVFGVELHVVDIDQGLREAILATQFRQKMVNVDVSAVADDVTMRE